MPISPVGVGVGVAVGVGVGVGVRSCGACTIGVGVGVGVSVGVAVGVSVGVAVAVAEGAPWGAASTNKESREAPANDRNMRGTVDTGAPVSLGHSYGTRARPLRELRTHAPADGRAVRPRLGAA